MRAGTKLIPWPATRLLAIFAAAFAFHYYILHELLGLLAVDEVYFAHVFWLMRQGLDLYSDFYANHLPTYFHLLMPVLPAGGPADLTFVWVLRATGALALAAYVAMLWTLSRRDFLYLLPVLLLFVVLGRMAEIRPDTIGLLLFNAGWWLLLKDTGRRNMLLAAALAGLALLFSARAAVMAVGMGALMAWLCAGRRDWRTFLSLAGIGVGFFALVGALYLADRQGFALMVRLVYLEPIAIMPDVPAWLRLLPIDRLLMVLLILIALLAAAVRGRERRAQVVLFACVTQFLLILVDPSPYQYVYGWAVIPVLAGLSMLGDRRPERLHQALAIGSSSLAAVAIILSVSGPTPRAGAMLRLTYDRPFANGELARASTPRLLQMATRSERQQGVWNQLALFSEICRRQPGPVLTKFYANMICQKDALYDWAGLQWPPIFEDDLATASREEFERLFAERPPALVAWGKQHYVPRLDPWGRALLAEYDIYEGYALRRQRAASPDPGAPVRGDE